MLNISRL